MCLYRGDTEKRYVDWTDESGTKIPLPAGTTAVLEVRENQNDDTPIIALTETDGITLTDPGMIDFVFTDEQTILLNPATKYYYDLRVTISSEVTTVMYGRIDVTERTSHLETP